MTAPDVPVLATLIDADNVSPKYADAILKEVATIGEPALRRVYADWSCASMNGWSEKILSLGMVAHQQTANTAGKNASDIGLVIDAMDILHARRFDGFVIVSSDSDFTSLANRLREDGLMVIGIGEQKTPISLRNACNRFIFLENLVGSNGGQDTTEEPKKENPNRAARLLIDAIGRIQQEEDWVHMGALGNAMSMAHPDFDTRTYGKSKLSDLVSVLQGFEIRREGTILMVRYVKSA